MIREDETKRHIETAPIVVRDQDGNIEALSNVIDFERSKEANLGEHKIKFAIFYDESNEHSTYMVENENFIIFDNEEYRIKRINPQSEQGFMINEVEARHTFFDIVDNYQYDELSKTLRIDAALEHALEHTDVEFVVENKEEFDSELFENFGDNTSLGLLQQIKDRFDAEFEIINSKKVKVGKKVGRETNAQFRHKYNIQTIDQVIDTTNLSTYIEGFGGVQDDTGEYETTAYFASPNAKKYKNPDGSIRINHAKPVRDQRYKQYDSLLKRIKREIQDEPVYSVTIEATEFVKNLEDIKANETDITSDFRVSDTVFVIYEPLDILMESRIVRVVDYPLSMNRPPVLTIDNLRNESTSMQANSGVSSGSGGAVGGGSDMEGVGFPIRANDNVWLDVQGFHQRHPDDDVRSVLHSANSSTYRGMLNAKRFDGHTTIDDGKVMFNHLPSPHDPPLTEVKTNNGWWETNSSGHKNCQSYTFTHEAQFLRGFFKVDLVLSENLVINPKMDTGSNGIADGFKRSGSNNATDYECSIDNSAQKIEISKVSDRALVGVEQTVEIPKDNVNYNFSVDYLIEQEKEGNEDFVGRIYIAWEDDKGEHLLYSFGDELKEEEGNFKRYSTNRKAPDGAKQARLMFECITEKGGKVGSIWFKNAELIRSGTGEETGEFSIVKTDSYDEETETIKTYEITGKKTIELFYDLGDPDGNYFEVVLKLKSNNESATTKLNKQLLWLDDFEF